jgi:uncharacterized protein (DUF58 family)
MKQFWQSFTLGNRAFYLLAGVLVLLIAGFWWSPLFVAGQVALVLAVAAIVADTLWLFGQRPRISGTRHINDPLSLGHTHHVRYHLHNSGGWRMALTLLDEWPEQMQVRDFGIPLHLAPGASRDITLDFRPVVRGQYHFGNLLALAATRAGLALRRMELAGPESVSVYPSIIEMKQFELKAMHRLSYLSGIRKLRRIGHSYEFEQIKNYVAGDDYRSINWNATGRRASLMVNQYEDERAQQVYALIDKGRSMRLPFHGMTLLDYSINATLTILNIALRKHDRTGLVTFHQRTDTRLKAQGRKHQIRRIMEALYRETPGQEEANFEALYQAVGQVVHGRSLLILFTNFESHYALERVLPILRKLNRMHLLLVVFFENTELEDYLQEPATDVRSVYTHTMAREFVTSKYRMLQTLQQHAIQCILTHPAHLTVNTVNKYLELKAKGLI